MTPNERNRRDLINTYGPLYIRHRIGSEERSFYCGDRRTCLDHRPPLALFNYCTPAMLRRLCIPLVLIASCHDCNGRLSSHKLATAQEALAHLYNVLNGQYERSSALWSEDEIREMGAMFQTMIRARKKKLQWLHGRILYVERRLFDEDLMPQFESPDDE